MEVRRKWIALTHGKLMKRSYKNLFLEWNFDLYETESRFHLIAAQMEMNVLDRKEIQNLHTQTAAEPEILLERR